MDPMPPYNSSAQMSQVNENNYNQYLNNVYKSNPTDCNNFYNFQKKTGQQSFADFNQSVVNKPYITHNLPLQFSDENPYRSNTKDLNTRIVRKKKIWISDTHKSNSSDVPEAFYTELLTNFKNIRYIKLLQVAVDYTVAATLTRDGFVYLPDFNQYEITAGSKQNKYHGYFPITQDSVGTTVRFNYTFNDHYITDFKNLDKLNNKIRVEVYYEDTTTGDFTAFTQLDHFGLELEINYIDFVNENDTQAV